MKKTQDQPADAAELRRRAEERLKRQRPEGSGRRTAVVTARLVHELQVHQIELEMQNEELGQVRAQLEMLLAQYTDLYDFAPTGYLTFDREGVIRQVNLTGARLLGVERSGLVNRRFGLFVAEGDRRTFSAFLDKVFASQAKEGCEVTLPQAGVQPLVLQIEGICSAAGQECRVVALDITARRQEEESLRQKSEELAAMTQQLWQMAKLATMGELAASVAHELNNPLTTISLHLEALMAKASASDDRQVLGVIGQEVERMAHLVAELLQTSRRRQPQISSVDLRQELDNTLELIHFHLRTHGISAAREYAPELPLVQADRQQLRQVLLNLFTNAGDAMAQGGILTIRAYPQPGGCTLEVNDNGTGIAPEDLPRVMEAFFTTKEEGTGTGLGLAICRRIMQEHNGTIQLDSQPGKGTTVRLFFPKNNDLHVSSL